MKIAYVTTYFYPFTGGAETNCFEIAKRIAKDHEVHVFTSGRADEEKKVENISVHKSKIIFRLKYYLAFYPGIKKLLEGEFDIVHFHSLGFLQHDLLLLKLKREYETTKAVVTPHGPFMALPRYSFLEAGYKEAFALFEKSFVNPKYDAAIQVNPFQHEWMTGVGIAKNRIHLIPNGVKEEAFGKAQTKPFKKRHGLEGFFVLGYLGRVQEYKGLQQVVKILPEVERTKFLVVGKDAGYRKKLEKLASRQGVFDRVVFTGRVSEKEKLNALASMDAFVFPSKWEAFGISMLEAMARAKPVISTRTEGGRYLVGKKGGFLFSYNDLASLEKHAKRLRDDKELRKRMGRENKLLAKKFLWKNIAKRTYKLYKELVQK